MSFRVKLNSINLDCAPMVTEGFSGETNLIGYMCKSNNTREIEGFENVQTYNDSTPYVPGDVVSYTFPGDGTTSIYKMIEGAGPPGYKPDRVGDKLWQLVSGPGNPAHPGAQTAPYNNNKPYKVGDQVSYQGSIFKMVEAAGPAGYAPDRVGDKLWQLVSGPGNTVHPAKNQVQQVQQQPVQIVKSVAQPVQQVQQAQPVQKISSSSSLVKYVRLSGGNDWINLSQLVVTDSNGVNVSRGRPTTSSGVHGGGDEHNAVDGDERPRHHPRGYHSSSDKNAFFQVTLDNPTNVASVTVYGRSDFGGRMTGHKISLLDSNNNVLFTSANLTGELKQTINITGLNNVNKTSEPVVAKSRSQSPEQPVKQDQVVQKVQTTSSGSVKYVKLGGGNDWINLSQLVVSDSAGANIAKGRPTTSSGVGFDGSERNAVDGEEQARGHPREYHSSGDKNAFFQVTLDNPTTVSSVTVYNRSDCCASRMASGHKIYLLDSNNNVLFTSANLTAELKQTIVIPKNKTPVVCGVNSSNMVYCAFEKIDSQGNWFQLPDRLTNVSISNGRLYGTKNDNSIYYADDYKNAKWTQVPGGLVQVSLDAQTPVVVGVNKDDAIWVADKNIETKPNWYQIDGALINVSVSNKKLYGCNRGNYIYYAADYSNPKWIQIDGSLKQVSLDGYNNVVCGVNSNNELYCADTNIYTKSPAWKKLNTPEGFIWISVSNGKLYGVGKSENIYYAASFVNPQWVKIPGALKQVSFDNY